MKKISNKTGKNIEKVIYAFYNFASGKLRELMNNNSKWISEEDPYIIEKNAKLLSNYNIWIDDNEDPKKVDTSSFRNYGYFLIE